MSTNEKETFINSIHPFELLSPQDLQKCIKNMDIAYYPKGEVIIEPEKIADIFFVIIKGAVEEFEAEELVGELHEMDSFDSDSLIYGKTKYRFVVSEDLICYELKKKTFLELLERNNEFKNFFLNNMVERFQTLKQKEYTSELSTFMVARVNEVFLHEPCIVSATTPIKDSIEKSINLKTSTIIVKRAEEDFGVVTDTDLKRDVLLGGVAQHEKISSIARFPIIAINHDDFLFNALLILTKHSIKRVAVKKKGEIVGILEQIDLLSYFANHTHIIAKQINNAKNLEDLKNASRDSINTVKALSAKGVKVDHISKLVSEFNTKIYEQVFKMTLPKDLHKKCALIVMGSEGRSEQIVKTDQDNALIIKDKEDVEQFRPYMEKVTEALIELGFPPCEGNIMVSNPYWCKSYTEYREEVYHWIENPDMESYMNFAIFFDSKFIAGDERLLKDIKADIFEKVKNKDVFMAYFARATLIFETPIGMFSNLIAKKDSIDLKKGGIFAIVHGVRSLALENGIYATTTTERIAKLEHKEILEEEQAEELIEAFDTLGTLRLKQQLKCIQKEAPVNNFLKIDKIGKLERDLLKDSFKIVDKFKKTIEHHFKLDYMR